LKRIPFTTLDAPLRTSQSEPSASRNAHGSPDVASCWLAFVASGSGRVSRISIAVPLHGPPVGQTTVFPEPLRGPAKHGSWMKFPTKQRQAFARTLSLVVQQYPRGRAVIRTVGDPVAADTGVKTRTSVAAGLAARTDGC
jgi:hypothetical protein